jgi:polysaccharide export outer membrane protein
MWTAAPVLKSRPAALLCLTAILVLLIGPAAPARAQLLPPPARPAPAPTDFPVGISDLLGINVLGVADFTLELRVSGSGTIRLPFLGEIQAAGLLPAQLEARLVELLNPNYVKDPQVSVIVKEPRSRMFSILGAVIKPGQYQMLEAVTLVTAIAGAGGLNLAKTGDKALIQRGNNLPVSQVKAVTAPLSESDDPPGAVVQIEVDLRRLLQGDSSRDVPIMPGDLVSIPEREETAFYVIGDVGHPGPFPFPPEQGMKLSRALAMAGGPTKTSKLSGTALIRQHPDGTMDRLALNLDKVLKGKDPDIALRPNDMIYVPGSLKKNIGWQMLGMLPSMLVTRLLYPF